MVLVADFARQLPFLDIAQADGCEFLALAIGQVFQIGGCHQALQVPLIVRGHFPFDALAGVGKSERRREVQLAGMAFSPIGQRSRRFKCQRHQFPNRECRQRLDRFGHVGSAACLCLVAGQDFRNPAQPSLDPGPSLGLAGHVIAVTPEHGSGALHGDVRACDGSAK